MYIRDSRKRLYARNKTDSSYKTNVSSKKSVSFPQLKFLFISSSKVPNACSMCKQTVLVYKQQHVYFVTSNDSALIWPLGLKKYRQVHVKFESNKKRRETVVYLSFIYKSCLLHVFSILQIKGHELLFKFNIHIYYY